MPRPPHRRSAPPAAVEVISDDMLCKVEFWTEEQWEALPDSRRPRERVHAPGRGWFAVVPVVGLN